MLNERAIKIKLVALILVLPVFYVLSIFVGSVDMPINDAFGALFFQPVSNESNSIILYNFRIPEALTAVL
ncbi:MAG TPA: iron ABC transporter permease, partial [Flavobacteriales bacterium]|nr:iron ABC transporter permease [Flavobacteriales bacterium]